MAITRRQFVTRVGALAAAAGLGQAELTRITEAFGYGVFTGKPKVVWVHGAECTGCSTSLLSLFEDVRGTAVEGTTITTGAALGLAVAPDALPRTLATYQPDGTAESAGALNVDGDANVVNIQDVLIDIIELNYHETVENMGGDLAAKFLKDWMDNTTSAVPYVLVVEGAIQEKDEGGAWDDSANNGKPWCSIGVQDNGTNELSFDDVVEALATKSTCKAVIAIGQCAAFGGYPGAKTPLPADVAGFDTHMSQTGAKGTYDFLFDKGLTSAADKVINVPGCPTNPWWFVLTVVAWLIDAESALKVPGATDGTLGILAAGGAINSSAIDKTRRLKITYPYSIHSAFCPRYNYYGAGIFAKKPGDQGCLQKLGCKGPAVKSLCGAHGWNAQQPHNSKDLEFGLSEANPQGLGFQGGHCTRAGHPCMACTEKGYPDSFVPYVTWGA